MTTFLDRSFVVLLLQTIKQVVSHIWGSSTEIQPIDLIYRTEDCTATVFLK